MIVSAPGRPGVGRGLFDVLERAFAQAPAFAGATALVPPAFAGAT
jgi:hypothetical protein